jgi:hypothetical protein
MFNEYKTFSWPGAAAIVYDPESRWEPAGFDTDAEFSLLINREGYRIRSAPGNAPMTIPAGRPADIDFFRR